MPMSIAVPRGRLTMLSHLARYAEYERIQRGRAPGTLSTYELAIRQFHAFLAAEGRDTNPDAVTRRDVEDFMTHLVYKRRIIKNSTRAQKRSALKSYFDFLIHDDLLMANPVDDVPSPRIPKRMPVKFTIRELALLFSATGDDTWGARDLAILKTLYAAGLRVSEVCGLDLEDVSDGGGYIRLQIQGKGAKQRVLTLKRNPAGALRRWLAHRMTMRTDHTAVFISGRHHARLSADAINDVLKKYAVRVGIAAAEVFVHKMRSTCFADMYDAAMDRCPHCGGNVSREDIFSLAAFAGHEDPKTMKEYVNISDKVQKKGIPDRRFTDIEKLAIKLRGDGHEG